MKFYIIVKKIFPGDTLDVWTKWFGRPTKCDSEIVCDEWYKIQQDIRFDFASDSYFTESKENEVLQERLNILRDINDHIGDYYSREYVRRNILRQTDSEMKEIDKQISFEREVVNVNAFVIPKLF